MATTDLTAARLRKLLHYDPRTGIFTWRERRCNVAAGSVAGTPHGKRGYISIRIDRVAYLAHRLAWLYVRGVWPSVHIDHRDGNKGNNIFTNLRDATRAVNIQNEKGPRKHNKSGFMGVIERRGGFKATIGLDGRNYHLGDFATAEEAHAAYLAAKRKMHPGCLI